MNADKAAIARACLEGAEQDKMTFPQIVAALSEAGFEGYMADFRHGTVSYYLPEETVTLELHAMAAKMAPGFDGAGIKAAIREAQICAPGYSYRGFCDKVARAGCAGYLVSLTGRRAVYFGGTGETHTEIFPR